MDVDELDVDELEAAMAAEAGRNATTAKVIKRAHAADAVASLKRLCSSDAPLVVDATDVITMSEQENQHQMQEIQASIAYLLQKEKAHAAALAAQKSAAEARAALRARYGVERVPLLGLQHLPKDAVIAITRFLSRADKLALSAVCYHLYVTVRNGVTLDCVRLRLHIDNAYMLANYKFPDRMMNSWVLTKELIIYIDDRLTQSANMRYVNRALHNILATFGCYVTLRVWPESVSHWPKEWYLPPFFMGAHGVVRVLDSPFSPDWIVPHYQPNNCISDSARPLVLPTVLLPTQDGRPARLYSKSPVGDAIRLTYYPSSTALFLLHRNMDSHMYNIVSSFTSLKRLVISCTPDNLARLKNSIPALSSYCANLTRIQLVEPPRTEYESPNIPLRCYCINYYVLTDVCNLLNRACPRVFVTMPLAPLTDDTSDVRTSNKSLAYVAQVTASQNLEWSIGSKWVADVLQWRRIDDESDNRGGVVCNLMQSYRIWKLRFAFELTKHSMPLLQDDSDAEYRLAVVGHSAYLRFLAHARDILRDQEIMPLSDTAYDAAVNVVKSAWAVIDPEMKQ